jgi:hypothetical protein
MFDTLTREQSGGTAVGEPISDRNIRIMVQNCLLHGQLVESLIKTCYDWEEASTLYKSVSKIEKGTVKSHSGADIVSDGERSISDCRSQIADSDHGGTSNHTADIQTVKSAQANQ